MSTSLMYHTQQIRGFQHSSLKFKDKIDRSEKDSFFRRSDFYEDKKYLRLENFFG